MALGYHNLPRGTWSGRDSGVESLCVMTHSCAGVDVVYSGSQKVLGAPPSTAPISFSPRARAKMAARKTKVQSFYFDMEWLAQYWAVDDCPRV